MNNGKIIKSILLGFTILVLVATRPTAAESAGCQISGSIPISPSTGTTCATALTAGQTKDIVLTVVNSSSTVPFPGTSIDAKLTGSIVYTMACTDSTCVTQLPGTFTFVPVGSTGCVSNDAGVASCSSIDSNHVAITMTATGADLPAGSATNIATIRVRASTPVSSSICGVYGERADSGIIDMVSNDVNCDVQATGGAQGSTSGFFPSQTSPSVSVPTMTEWGMMIFTVLAGFGSVYFLRRQKRANN